MSVQWIEQKQSPGLTVFFQQLGRGLRKSLGKKYLNVLDFIGNYKRAIFIPFFLCGKLSTKDVRNGTRYLPKEDVVSNSSAKGRRYKNQLSMNI